MYAINPTNVLDIFFKFVKVRMNFVVKLPSLVGMMSTDNKHDDESSSLKKLGRSLEVLKERRAEEEALEKASTPMGDAMGVGLELVAGVVVGTFIGYTLDAWLETKPLFMLVCFFLGTAGGFANVIRRSKHEITDDEENE